MRMTRAIASLEAQQASRKFGGICLRTLKTEIIVGHSVQTKQMWCVHVSVVRRSSHAIMENCLACKPLHVHAHIYTICGNCLRQA